MRVNCKLISAGSSCPRTRESGKQPARPAILPSGRRLSVGGGVPEIQAYLLGTALHHPVAADSAAARLLEAQLTERPADAHRAELLRDAAAGYLHGTAGVHKRGSLALKRLPEVHADKLQLHVGALEITVMGILNLYLLGREIVAEAAEVERIRLTVDALVVERMVARRGDALHLEGHPAAVARGVAEKLRVVARAAERGDMRAVLGIAGVGLALVDMLHGDDSLEAVEVGGGHAVELLVAHQGIAREVDHLVARHAADVDFRVEVAPQLRRQQIVEPGGLVGSLLADEHQYDMIHRGAAHPRGNHSHEPLLEHVIEGERPSSPDPHRGGKVGNMVVVALLPSRQALQIVDDGIEMGRVTAVHHVVDVVLPHPETVRHVRPEGVQDAVGERLPALAAVITVLCVEILNATADVVEPQTDAAGEKPRDVVDSGCRQRGVAAAAVLTALAARAAEARAYHLPRVGIVAEAGLRPVHACLPAVAAFGEHIAHAHHIGIMAARSIHDALGSEPRGNHAVVVVLYALFGPFPVAYGSCRVGKAPHLGGGKWHGGGKEMHPGVVGKPRQAPHVLALAVGLHAQQTGVVVVASGEDLLVELHLLAEAVALVNLIAEDDAQPAAADGDIAQQRVGIRHSLPAECGELLRLNMVEVDERQPRHLRDVAPALASRKRRRHGKERALLLYCLTAVLTVQGGDLCEAPVGADVFRNRLKGGTPGLLAPEVPEAGYLHSLIKFLLRSVWHRFDYKGTNN